MPIIDASRHRVYVLGCDDCGFLLRKAQAELRKMPTPPPRAAPRHATAADTVAKVLLLCHAYAYRAIEP